ncbi:hypothetical protein GCM10010381_60600 [Streptomyces xantholiticus]|nr:hypothetical protein [Streptomyces xantholiticus]GGW67513.1 hypothetical protein GCM10010381_60600 [Streptomyces xantholiticus]
MPIPKRWIVEPAYGIPLLHRRLVRDYEHLRSPHRPGRRSSAQLEEFHRTAEEIRITRRTLLELPEPPAPKLPDHPAYQQIMAVLAATEALLRARQVCEAMDPEIAPNPINDSRLKLKRLIECGIWSRPSRACPPIRGRQPPASP